MPNQSTFIVSWFKINTGPKSEKQERKLKLCDITCKWNLKKYNKPVNITKKKQIHRNREQTSGYQ